MSAFAIGDLVMLLEAPSEAHPRTVRPGLTPGMIGEIGSGPYVLRIEGYQGAGIGYDVNFHAEKRRVWIIQSMLKRLDDGHPKMLGSWDAVPKCLIHQFLKAGA